MDGWCELVSSYPGSPEPKHLIKALRTADTLIVADLAPFEIEWLIQTLLYKPMDIINIIISKRTKEEWHKIIADSFKIISKIVGKYWSYVQKDNEKLVQLCQLPFDPQTRKEALYCLINILKNPGAEVGDALSMINALESDNTCKAPLALLVGSLCRYCPESVDQNYNRIWRIYLNILQSQNKTDTIMSAVLQGIDGLLENFGRDISIQELQYFYKDFSRKCAKISKCIEPLLSILKSHSGLFREKLLEDKVLRLYVWGLNSTNIKDALLAIYTVIFADVPKERIELLIKSEIYPYTNSESNLVQHTAYRIIINAKIYYGISAGLIPRPDYLEFQMRYRKISYQETDLVSLCLESQETYVKSLLMSAIMYYDNLPVGLRKDLVVKGIQDSSTDVRKVALILLIELCKQNGCLEKYADVWRDLLDTENKGDIILKETLQYMTMLFKNIIEKQKNMEEILSLSTVLSFTLSASETYDPTQYIDLIKSCIEDLSVCLCICPSVILSSKYLCTEMFKSKSILRELLSTLKNNKDDDTLSNVQKVFNNYNVETKLLVMAVSEMSKLLKFGYNLDYRQVTDIMNKVVKLKTKKTECSGDGRILQRELTVFIGEHGKLIEKEHFTTEMYTFELKNKIIFDIPNVIEGINYKLDLLRMVQLCLRSAAQEMQYCLLVVISANLQDRPDTALQTVAWKCVHAFYSSGGCADVTSVLRMCVTTQCIQLAIQSIKEERNPEVRQKLCECLQVMLLQDPGSEDSAQYLTVVGDELLTMMKSIQDLSYQSGIDIAKIFLHTLHNHDNLTIKYLPKILMKTYGKIDKELYKISTDIFIEKIDIFDDNINDILSDMYKCMLENHNRIDLEYILKFLKRIYEVKFYEVDYFVNEIIQDLNSSCDVVTDPNNINNIDIFSNLLQILSLCNDIFNMNENDRKLMIEVNDYVLIDKINVMLDNDININMLKNILKFNIEYFGEIMDLRKEQTIDSLSKLIKSTTPDSLYLLKKQLISISTCLRTNNSVLPQQIIDACQKWWEKINLKEISSSFSNDDIFAISDTLKKYSDSLQSMSLLSKLFDCQISDSHDWTQLLIKDANKIRPSMVLDMLVISENCLSLSEFGIMMENNLEFVQKYIEVYFKKILEYSKNGIIDSSLFVCAVKYFADNYKTYEEHYEDVVGLFDKIIPKFELMDFKKQLSVASDMWKIPRKHVIPLLSNWAKTMISSDDIDLDKKLQIIAVLPGGQEYSVCYRYMAGRLPVRLSELQGNYSATFRCLLDCLASCGDLTLLDIVVTLAAGDDSKGWYDDAIDACMASLADRRDDAIFDAAYNACMKITDIGGCSRVFVPLLKHSSRSYCEEYACKIIVNVLDTFKKGFIAPSNTELYRERVLSYAKAFSILQVIVNKVPAKNLESGIINMSAGYQDPWHIIKDICIYSVTLRDKVRCPDNATDAIKEACLRLQCAAYNCLTSSICKRRPSQKQYTAVFNHTAWTNIVDIHALYNFTPRAFWNDNRIKRNSDTSTASSSTFTGTVRTRLFMATLSENPLQYDMIPNYEDEEETEEERPEPYENHPLNVHGVLSTITELLVHATTLHHTEWVDTLIIGVNTLAVNVKWTLAQAICNAELALKPHASVLVPALLELIATTPNEVGGKQTLNNLHIDILWTIMRWEIKELSNFEHLNICIQYTISSCIEYRSKDGLYKRLLSTLNSLLQMYGNYVEIKWSFLQNYCNDLPSNAFYLLPILQKILKNNIPLPGLLSLCDKFDSRQWISTSKLPEVFALALSLESNKIPHLARFRQALSNVKGINIGGYVKLIMYTQRVCWQCCDLTNLKVIADLAPKIEKSKCLSIIAIYLEHMGQDDDDGFCCEMFHIIGLKELLDSDCVIEALRVVHGGIKLMDATLRSDVISDVKINCRNCSVKIRKEAYRVMLKVFQDIALIKPSHSAKRQALENTPILNIYLTNDDDGIMSIISDGIFDGNDDIAVMMRDGVEECLSKDMAVRFAELFYIIFYFGKDDYQELSNYGYVFMELLFRDLQRQDSFKDKRLSDQPLPSDNDIGLTTQTAENIRSIDVQMPISDIFQVFLESAKSNSQICEELLLEILKRLRGTSRRFEFDDTIAKILADVMKKEPNCMTPLFIEISRMFLNNISSIDGYKNTLNILKSKLHNSNSSTHFNILYEDLMLKCEGRNLFKFSFEEDDIDMLNYNQEFSIEGVTEVFGSLSNWDDLRIQDRRRVEQSLPPLFIEITEFEYCLKEYYDDKQTLDYSKWFNKLVGAYCSTKLCKPMVQYKEHWLKDAEKWPTRDYVTSAVLESINFLSNDGEYRFFEITPSDCLAEWAARLMIRSCYYSDDPGLSRKCRNDELQFCREANIRCLPKVALQCINRNKEYLLEDEALSWFHEKVVAHRTLALRSNDQGMMQKALDVIDRQDISTNICLQKLMLRLHNDLEILTEPKLNEILTNMNNNVEVDNGVTISSTNNECMKSAYDLAMDYYDGLWETNETSIQEDIIRNMVNVIQKKVDYNLFNDYNILVAMLWNRLTQFDGILNEDLAQKLMDLIAILEPKLDAYSKQIIKNNINIFPVSIRHKFGVENGDEPLNICKQYLYMIRDPQYALLHYCDKLFYAKDQDTYKSIFNDMKKSLFTNKYGGTEYRSLNTIKNKLFTVENVDNIVARHRVLKSIMDELKSKVQRSILRLSQLSPELTKPAVLEIQKTNIQTLLALPSNVFVVKFLEQIQVFRDAIRRPCILTAMLSNGCTKRYIIKSGEPLYNDASVQRAVNILPMLCRKDVRGYNVTALAEDAAIIEYLEDHERLRELMGDAVNIPLIQRLADDKLVLSPSLALEQFREMCNKVPIHTLRYAIEQRCSSVQQFIYKKHTFMETLCTMTITNWLFGVGDRHLHNILIYKQDGGLCGVDWASTFQYGLREFVPARLTANFLAVCDVTVFESRLQGMLLCLREKRKTYEAFVNISFHWKGRHFSEMKYISDILRGSALSHEITRNVLEQSNVKLKDEYIKMIDLVFEDCPKQHTYSVEEQIKCLLKHCTDERLLSITPQGWEAWI